MCIRDSPNTVHYNNAPLKIRFKEPNFSRLWDFQENKDIRMRAMDVGWKMKLKTFTCSSCTVWTQTVRSSNIWWLFTINHNTNISKTITTPSNCNL